MESNNSDDNPLIKEEKPKTNDINVETEKEVKEEHINEDKKDFNEPIIIENNNKKNDKTLKEDKERGYKKDAYHNSNIFSKLFFFWSFYILYLARKIQLQPCNLGTLSSKNDSSVFSKNIAYFWDQKGYKNKKSNALMKTILRTNICRLIAIIFLSALSSGAEYVQVLLTKEFIDTFESISDPKIKPMFGLKLYQTGIAFLSVQFVYTLLTGQSGIMQGVFGARAGYELSCFIYDKILKISPSSFGERATQGEIVNFIQIDSNQLNRMVQVSPNTLISPILIGAYIYLLFQFFGLAFLAGIGVMAIFLFGNYRIFKGYRVVQKEKLKRKDERMKVTTETFESIKLLKLYNWENEFKEKIIEARESEMVSTRKQLNLSTTNISLFWLCPICVSIATIGVYQALNSQFSIGTMLIGLAIFARLQDPVRSLPSSINAILETIVSMRRIEKFIRQPERDQSVLHREQNSEFAIRITNGSFTWGQKQKSKEEKEKEELERKKNKKEKKEKKIVVASQKKEDKIEKTIEDKIDEPLIPESNRNTENILKEPIDCPGANQNKSDYDIVLKNISIAIKPGEIVGIIGEVGSGKSSLLQAILNSLILLNPNECDGIHISGSVGYVAQIPWIQNATIKNNILFFNEYDQKKYQEVLEASQLSFDLDNFEGGDNTEIGEKGINLSGGQKVRVSLARVLYSNPDIYLFDDPISALDANIGKKIMKECIVKYLEGKTRIIVTHALNYLKYMDKIIYLQNGHIEWEGKYSELLEQPFFDSMRKLSKLSKHRSSDADEAHNIMLNMEGENKEEQEIKKSPKKETKIIADEDRELGTVKLNVYCQYFKYNGGICFMLIIVLVMVFWQVNKAGSDLWLAYWSKIQDETKKWVFFGVYSSLGVASAFFVFLRICLLTVGICRLLRKLHTDMIDKLIKAPINLFHETIPRGQIYNRVSKDLDSLTFTIYMIGNSLVAILSVIGSLVLCSIYDLYSLIFLPFMAIIGYLLTSFSLKGSRQLSRMEAISHSPILNTISETIPGIISIFAFNKEEQYLQKFFSSVNDSFKINIFVNGVYNWFNLQFNLISLLYMVYLVLITVLKQEEFDPQSIAIMFTYSVILQKNLGWLFLSCSILETNMVAMERCLKYTEVQGEKESVLPIDKELIEKKWPQEGKIRFENYSVKYRPNTEIVLKNLNFEIESNKKIGVVGRTGSGKSTIFLCLFRILEPLTGTIYIDNQDICNIGLDLLRQNLTIIPQDPCLMAGSLRYNIDPLNRSTDEDILKVLKQVGLELEMDNKKSKEEDKKENQENEEKQEKEENILEKEIEQNGVNLSVGEKQLVCIARAILRKTKIVVMDEATANIDMKTEEKIQNSLLATMNNCTIITIAHRIKTIIDYDKILVLDNGEIKEFDSPKNLLSDENSLFYQLYSKSVI